MNKENTGCSNTVKILPVVSLLPAVLLAGWAQAATITVDEATDDDPAIDNGSCSLREAVIAANTNSGVDACVAGEAAPGVVDEIVFDSTLDGTAIGLSIPGTSEDAAMTGDLDILEDVNIIGNGGVNGLSGTPPNILLDGGGIDRVIDTGSISTVLIEQLAVTGGAGVGAGGGIMVGSGSTLTLRNVVVTENVAESVLGTDTASGGGIFASTGDLILENSAVFGNAARAKDANSAIGGGIRALGNLTIRQSLIQLNGAESESDRASAGGISYFGGGDRSLVITESVIANNRAVGALNASGGGLQATGSGNASIERSAIINNSVQAAGGRSALGGGVLSLMPVTVVNSTISGNRAESDTGSAVGGWVISQDTVTFNNVSFLGNSAISGTVFNATGGIQNVNGATASISNTTLIGNTESGGENSDCRGSLTSANHNILGDNTGCDFTPMANDQVGDVAGGGQAIAVADVFETGEAVDNGGGFMVGENFVPHFTVALSQDSLALDAGDPNQPGAGGSCETGDQRGAPRPEDGDGAAACDIGAVEGTKSQPRATFNPAVADTSIAEDAGAFLIEDALRLSFPFSAETTVDIVFDAAASGAESPADFEQMPATATFAPGATRADLEITPVDDGDVEGDETIVFSLSDPVNATLGAPDRLTLILLDNDEEEPPGDGGGSNDTGTTPPPSGGGGSFGLALLAVLVGGLYRRIRGRYPVNREAAL